ncbi:MAG TPA: heavy metal sensor histidine kinase [Planctomycetota bacterium]|nr:heavy metal sensor histidine kinase [Planctomycetota bacterium]
MSSTRPAERARGSLAGRLTLWYSLFSFLLILGCCGYLYWALGRNLEREDDGILQDQIHILQVLLREHPHASDGIRQEVEVETGARQHSRIFIRILDEAGQTLAETPGMAEPLPKDAIPGPSGGSGATLVRRGRQSFRVLSAAAPLGDRPGARILQVALDQKEDEKLLRQFGRRILPLLGVSLLVCAAAGYQIARRGLRPIGRISDAAARIRSTTLHERLPSGEFPEELGGLARTFNDMLDRLQESFDRLSRFSADLAHELRTPLNTLRGEVEVALGRVRSPEEYRDTLASFLEEAGRLTRLIESLLFLARAEDPKMEIRCESLDLAGELRSLADFYEAAAADRGVALATEAPPGLRVSMDRGLFQRAAGNLIDNALAHTPKGGQIRIRADRENGSVRVEVSDTGAGIAPEHLPRVFDRLYRADRARSATTGGSGLGLAIVKSIAELHGGKAEIASEVARGTRVSLILPAEPSGDMTKK